MRLKDFMFVAVYDPYLVGVEKGGVTLEEFSSSNKEKLKTYENCIVSAIFVLDECTLAVTIIKEENDNDT